MEPVVVVGWWTVPTHGLFVGLGVAVAAVVFVAEARRRGAPAEQSLVAVAGALVGGAIGMRLSGWAEHLDPDLNPSLLEAWMFGSRSVLGGLTGAYAGVLVAKRLIGYRERTGDLFAPAVALGMAVGRIGCHLTEAPGRPTGLPWGVHAPATTPGCPGCLAGQAMHPSFLYEIAFHLAAFAALWWLRSRITRPGELFTLYVAAYAAFRFLVEFTRANETVWLDLTRPQWFLVPGLLLVAARLGYGYRRGFYDPLVRKKEMRA
ncbi:prolipoprotein diacylglyceryl transferase [Planomonospora venezuelensis]|uniref:Prolipoprotein diacylglyceryltransferase n=1 Tax=Planomonospora venezuelensis TaxID=1999 RepID=A0A841CX61_PLAVE|nr:prolipoprotein diacylglyceryl transferase family protein [Planomonospora venezuelensis]MBB5960904.1 prolipoprotein diacylglyceryltransferase [Planomonospora venezuelensis]GIN01140.1 diacylglyceryl transferase [Planomonospora venezuelensis]